MSNENALIPGTDAWFAQQEAVMKGAALRARSGFTIAPAGTHLGIVTAASPAGTGWRENPETGEHVQVPLFCMRVQLNAPDLNKRCVRSFVDWWAVLSYAQRSNLTALLSELRITADQHLASMGSCLLGMTVLVVTENTSGASGKEFSRVKRIGSAPEGSICLAMDCDVTAGAPSRVPIFYLEGYAADRRSDEPLEQQLFDLPGASFAIAKRFNIEPPLGLPSGVPPPELASGEGVDSDDVPF